MDSSNIERISKALANETRLLIFEAIARNKEMTSSTIVALRRVAAATVSHHLKILSHAGLIECRRQGQFRAQSGSARDDRRLRAGAIDALPR
jgi:DNA-binding transcriptional ArsR family regulator